VSPRISTLNEKPLQICLPTALQWLATILKKKSQKSKNFLFGFEDAAAVPAAD